MEPWGRKERGQPCFSPKKPAQAQLGSLLAKTESVKIGKWLRKYKFQTCIKLVVREIGKRTLEARIHSFKLFQSLGLVNTNAAIFLAPTVKGLLGYTEFLDRLYDGQTLSLQNFSLAKLADNRFGGESFSCRDPVLLSVKY